MSNNHKWTANDIPDQTGRVAIVTGANSGIGYETAKALAQKGATVILACRSLAKGETAVSQIRQETPTAKLDLMQLDLSDLSSVHQFVQEFKERHTRLDLLINNAGVMVPPFTKTKDGFELQFGTNHLGHFALTGLLLLLASFLIGLSADDLWAALAGMACLLLGAALLLPSDLRVLIIAN